MKKPVHVLLLSLACMSAATNSDAQSLRHGRNPLSTRHSKINSGMPVSMNPNKLTAAKTTATDARLTSIVFFDCDGTAFVVTDSMAFTYAGSRGWKHYDDGNEFEWLYSDGEAYEYDLASSTYGSHSAYKETQTFDANDNPTSSLGEDWDAPSSTWKNSYQVTSTYDAASNRLTRNDQDWVGSVWQNSYMRTKAYSATNKEVTDARANWNTTTSSWDNTSKYTNTYDASDRLATILYQTWNSTASAWENNDKTTITYDGAGNESLREIQDWTGGAWVEWIKSTFTYDASNNLLTSSYEHWDGSSWNPSGKQIRSNYFGYHPQTEISQSWDASSMSFINTWKYNYTYNSYNKIETYFDQKWDAATSAWILTDACYSYRQHYEPFTTSINDVATFRGTASVFPVPSCDNATIDVNWSTPQPFTVSIIDMQGRVHTSWTQPAKAHYTEEVSLSNLPSGNYIIAITGTTEKTSLKLAVIK